MKSVFRTLLTISIIAGLAWLATRLFYENAPKSRIAANELWNASQGLRLDIESAARQKSSINEALKLVKLPTTLATPSGNATVTATGDGQLSFHNQGHGVTLMLRPDIKDGLIVWSCSGTPAEAMPVQCRGSR